MTWLKEWYPVVKLFFYSFSIYLLTVKCGSPNAAKNNCWNERRVYAHMETYIWGFTGHGVRMNVSNKDVYQDQFNNSNIHSIKKMSKCARIRTPRTRKCSLVLVLNHPWQFRLMYESVVLCTNGNRRKGASRAISYLILLTFLAATFTANERGVPPTPLVFSTDLHEFEKWPLRTSKNRKPFINWNTFTRLYLDHLKLYFIATRRNYKISK